VSDKPAIEKGIEIKGNQVVMGIVGIKMKLQSMFMQVNIIPYFLSGFRRRWWWKW
jgi:hypothetical protein